MMTPFNTGFILPNGFDMGGVTTWSIELAERLAREGRKTTLFRHIDRYAPPGKFQPAADVIECSHTTHPNNWYLFRGDIDEYIKTYRKVLPSILIPNYSFGSYAACAVLTLEAAEKIRIIGMAHTDNSEYYRWLVRFESVIHTFVAVSREIAETLADLIPHRREDIVCKPYGVMTGQSLTRQYSPSDQPVKLMYAGRLSERQKCVSELVRLAAILADEHINFELHIYGSGRDQSYLEYLIGSLTADVRNRIRLAGQVDPKSMPQVYQAADIFVLVSGYEGTSVSMLEAMAQGCVPVVTAVSGTAEVIEQGENGFSVPVGDLNKMAEKIGWLARHRRQMEQLGKEAFTVARERYSYEQYVPWFSAVLDEAWQKEPRKWKNGNSFWFHFPLRQFIKEAGYTLASKPGLRCLYRLRKPARRIVG